VVARIDSQCLQLPRWADHRPDENNDDVSGFRPSRGASQSTCVIASHWLRQCVTLLASMRHSACVIASQREQSWHLHLAKGLPTWGLWCYRGPRQGDQKCLASFQNIPIQYTL